MDRAELPAVPLSCAPVASAGLRPAPPALAPAALAPAALGPAALAARLVELCREERALQVEFLLHLMEFDDRRAYAGAGYPSLWAYCTEVLHLREGATWRRIEAMKLLRRFPSLEAPLRAGGLCLTTINLLGPVLTEENVDELVGRAAFLSKVETQRLVAAIRDAEATDERTGGSGGAGAQALPLPLAPVPTGPDAPASAANSGSDAGEETVRSDAPAADRVVPAAQGAGSRAPVSPLPSQRAELRPAGKDAWSLRVTLDDAAREELLALAALTAHSTRGDLAAVVRDAVRAALARHRKRRGAVRSERNGKAAASRTSAAISTTAPATPSVRSTTTSASSPAQTSPEGAAERRPAANEPAASTAAAPARGDPRAIPMAVREAVWERDGGRCAWVSPEGKRCGSTWKLELGHVRPVALGGEATVDGLRLECARTTSSKRSASSGGATWPGSSLA